MKIPEPVKEYILKVYSFEYYYDNPPFGKRAETFLKQMWTPENKGKLINLTKEHLKNKINILQDQLNSLDK